MTAAKMRWKHFDNESRLVDCNGCILSTVVGQHNGTWRLSYNCAGYDSREAAMSAANRIHGFCDGGTSAPAAPSAEEALLFFASYTIFDQEQQASVAGDVDRHLAALRAAIESPHAATMAQPMNISGDAGSPSSYRARPSDPDLHPVSVSASASPATKEQQ